MLSLRRMTLSAILLAFATLLLAGAQKNTGSNSTTIMFDCGPTYSTSSGTALLGTSGIACPLSSSPLLTQSDNSNQDVCGGNCAQYSASSGATSRVGTSWQMLPGSGRTVYLTLSYPVPGSGSQAPPSGLYNASVEVYSICFNNGTQVSWNALPAGGLYPSCSLGVDFSYNRTKYKLAMSPNLPAASCPSGGCPPTGWAMVTCNGVDASGACNNWTVAPNINDGVPFVANLYRFDARGKLVYVGQYYNTYAIKVTP